MALIFTESQIQELTGQLLAAEEKKLQALQRKELLTKTKADYLDLDNANAAYTAHILGIIDAYHTEYKYLQGTLRTTPTTANIDDGGRLAPGNIYFPSTPTPWLRFQPKMQLENNGYPESPFTPTEPAASTLVSTAAELLTDGFNDGAGSATSTGGFVGVNIEVTSISGFTVGDRVVILSGANYLYGTIDSLGTMPSPNMDITLITANAGYGGITSGATIENALTAFSNSERESGASPMSRDTLMQAIKASIDTYVTDLETILVAEETALNSNDATGEDATTNQAALGDLSSILTAINTWQAQPSLGVGTSRFGDTYLSPFLSAIAARDSFVTTRAAQVAASLGTLSQAPEGPLTGSGQYLAYGENLNQRLNLVSGTLRQYYASDLAIRAIDDEIALILSLQARDSATFDIRLLTAEPTGSRTVTVDNPSGLTVSNAVRIISNTVQPLVTTITEIVDDKITLADPVPPIYTTQDKARLVRLLV